MVSAMHLRVSLHLFSMQTSSEKKISIPKTTGVNKSVQKFAKIGPWFLVNIVKPIKFS